MASFLLFIERKKQSTSNVYYYLKNEGVWMRAVTTLPSGCTHTKSSTFLSYNGTLEYLDFNLDVPKDNYFYMNLPNFS